MVVDMNLTDPRFLLDAVQCLGLLALWLRKPGDDAKSRIEVLDAQVKVIQERLTHMPSQEELTELEGSVRELVAELGGMRDAFQTLRESVRRIEDFLLSKK